MNTTIGNHLYDIFKFAGDDINQMKTKLSTHQLNQQLEISEKHTREGSFDICDLQSIVSDITKIRFWGIKYVYFLIPNDSKNPFRYRVTWVPRNCTST